MCVNHITFTCGQTQYTHIFACQPTSWSLRLARGPNWWFRTTSRANWLVHVPQDNVQERKPEQCAVPDFRVHMFSRTTTCMIRMDHQVQMPALASRHLNRSLNFSISLGFATSLLSIMFKTQVAWPCDHEFLLLYTHQNSWKLLSQQRTKHKSGDPNFKKHINKTQWNISTTEDLWKTSEP